MASSDEFTLSIDDENLQQNNIIDQNDPGKCHDLKSEELSINSLEPIDLNPDQTSKTELKSNLKLKKSNQPEIRPKPNIRNNVKFNLSSSKIAKTENETELEVSKRMNDKIKIEIIGLFNQGLVKNALHSTDFKQSLEDNLRDGMNLNDSESATTSPTRNTTRSHSRPKNNRPRRVFEEDNPDDDSSDSPRQSPPRQTRVRSNTSSRRPAFSTGGQRHRHHTGNTSYRRNTVGPSLPQEISERLARYNLSQHQRDTIVADIQNLVSNQVVTTQLAGEFRGTLELHLQRRADRISEGMDPEDIIEDIQRRGDNFTPSREVEATFTSEPRPAANTQAIRDLSRQMDDLKMQMGELQRMMRVSFEVQQYIQRSIRQEISAAMNSFMTHNCGGPPILQVPAESIITQLPNVIASGEPMPGTTTPASYGMCVVCTQNQIDSMVYRCGHMCVCQPCGYELIGQKLKCPMCRSPIVDVVKVYKTSA